MGIAVFVIVASVLSLSLGILVGRFTAPDRTVRKDDLIRARTAISEMGSLALTFQNQTDIVGQEMARGIREIENAYWRGIKA